MWLLVSSHRTPALQEDWPQRFRVLQKLILTRDAAEAFADVIPTLCHWIVDLVNHVSTLPHTELADSAELSQQRITIRRRISGLQRLLIHICTQNISALSESDQDCIVSAALKAFQGAIQPNPSVFPNESKPQNSPFAFRILGMPTY